MERRKTHQHPGTLVRIERGMGPGLDTGTGAPDYQMPLTQSAGRGHRIARTVLAVLVLLAGMLVGSATTTQAAMAGSAPNGFKSVGYMPSWAGNVNNVQYTKLTHINYAFVMPEPN